MNRSFRRWWWNLDISARLAIRDALWFAVGGLVATLIILALP